MINLSTTTGLPPEEIADRAYAYFVDRQGLVLIERVKHLHGQEGAVEISVTGGRFIGDETYDSRTVFADLVSRAQNEYGLRPVYLLLHLHAAQKDDPGHLLVQIGCGSPAELIIETQAYEHLAKEFIASLPKQLRGADCSGC